MTFFRVFFHYILPASMLNWLLWFAIYGFDFNSFPIRELGIGFVVAFTSVVSHIAVAIWAFNKNNVIFMALVLGSMPLRLLFVFAEVALTIGSAEIQKGVFISGLLFFYFTYLYLEIYIFVKSANINSKRGLNSAEPDA